MKYTGNLNLKKPEGTDIVNIDDLNENIDILDVAVAGKVDKVTGKGLSDENFTATEKNKLAGIATGANNYTHPATHPASMITEAADKRFMTDAERTKLAGIATGANNYTHPANHPASIISQDASNRFVTDTEKVNWNAKETPAGAQTKVDTHANNTTTAHGATSAATANKIIIRDAAGRAKVAAPSAAEDIARKDTVDVVQTNLNAHLAETASTAKGGHVQLSDAVNSTSTTTAATANAVKKAYDRAEQAFTQVSEGKQLIAAALADKGVVASGGDSFTQLASKINTIEEIKGATIAKNRLYADIVDLNGELAYDVYENYYSNFDCHFTPDECFFKSRKYYNNDYYAVEKNSLRENKWTTNITTSEGGIDIGVLSTNEYIVIHLHSSKLSAYFKKFNSNGSVIKDVFLGTVNNEAYSLYGIAISEQLGKVFIVFGGRIVVVDLNGNLLYTILDTIKINNFARPRLDPSGRYLYVSYYTSLLCYDMVTYAQVWKYDFTDGYVRCLVAGEDDYVYVANYSKLYKLKRGQATSIWNVSSRGTNDSSYTGFFSPCNKIFLAPYSNWYGFDIDGNLLFSHTVGSVGSTSTRYSPERGMLAIPSGQYFRIKFVTFLNWKVKK